EMTLLRVIHASQLPDPGELMKKLASGEAVASAAPAAPAGVAVQDHAQQRLPESFPAMIEMLANGGKAHIAQQLHDYVGLIRYAPPALEIRPAKPLPSEFNRDLAAALKALTGTTWEVSSPDGPAEPTLLQQEQSREADARDAILATPIVRAAFDAFPEAELVEYKTAG